VSATVDVVEVPIPAALVRLGKERGPRSLGDPLRFALTGGEDYELLFTVRSNTDRSGRVQTALAAAGCKPRRIGRVIARRRAAVVDSLTGKALAGGFSHFGERK